MTIETRTKAIVDALFGMPSYINLKSKAIELLKIENQTLTGVDASLRHDLQLIDAWDSVKQTLMANKKLWIEISRHWSIDVTRSLLPLNTFMSGVKWQPLGVKQQALLKYVEAQALAAPPTDDDDTVADQCVDEVDRR